LLPFSTVSSNRQPCLLPFSTVSSNKQPCLPPGFPSLSYPRTYAHALYFPYIRQK
jgi:hypothetical protein